jgi:hypothetical protein
MTTQFPISILASEAPHDATMVGIASLLPSSNFERDRWLVLEPPPQTLALQYADLDFGHVEPTRMFGRLVKLDATQQRRGCLVTEHLLKAGAKMRVEVVKNQVNCPGSRVNCLQQSAYEVHKVHLRATRSHFHDAPFALGFDGHEEVAGTRPFVLVILLGQHPGLEGQRGAHVLEQLLALLIIAYHQFPLHIGQSVEVEQAIHPAPIFLGQTANTPHQLTPRFEAVFFRNRRMVSRLI